MNIPDQLEVVLQVNRWEKYFCHKQGARENEMKVILGLIGDGSYQIFLKLGLTRKCIIKAIYIQTYIRIRTI